MNPFTILALVAINIAQQSQGAVEWQVVVRPDTVLVGTPFEVIVRVSAPRGSVIRFPGGPDSSAAVRMLDPVAVATDDSVQATVQSGTYRLAAWDVGAQRVAIGDVVVATAAGTRRFQTTVPRVMVLSVLPPDSAGRVAPRPAREVFGKPIPWWYPWLPLLILAALLIALFVWWYRHRRASIAVPLPADGALERAERDFERIGAMHLVDAGEKGRHVVLMVDTLREFLSARFDNASPSLTSAELLAAIEPNVKAPVPGIAALLHDADLVKFARGNINAATALRLGRDAIDVARSIGNPEAVPSSAPAAPSAPSPHEDAA